MNRIKKNPDKFSMMNQFVLPSKLARVVLLVMFFLFIAIFLLSTKNHSPSYTQHNRELKELDISNDILERMEIVETKLDILTEDLKIVKYNKPEKVLVETVQESIGNYTVTVNKTYRINPFWTGDNDIREYDELYEVHNKNHRTCLVSEFKCKHTYKLLILITTHISHFKRRQNIRQTWGKDQNNRWTTYFLVGRSAQKHDLHLLKGEIETFGDIVLGNVYEDFYNLTSKVQAGFEWSIRYCDYEFLLKGDDDVFVNMPVLFNYLDSQDTPNVELYSGNVQYAAHVFRSGRYGIAKHEFKKQTYPRYCSGGGFIVSRDVVRAMVNIFDKVKTISIDDAYVGILALKAGIDAIHDGNFKMFENEQECPYRAESIVHHPVKTPECMEKLFKESLKDNNI